jgi:hypothetical protein
VPFSLGDAGNIAIILDTPPPLLESENLNFEIANRCSVRDKYDVSDPINILSYQPTGSQSTNIFPIKRPNPPILSIAASTKFPPLLWHVVAARYCGTVSRPLDVAGLPTVPP